jgi:hypothetical protein
MGVIVCDKCHAIFALRFLGLENRVLRPIYSATQTISGASEGLGEFSHAARVVHQGIDLGCCEHF